MAVEEIEGENFPGGEIQENDAGADILAVWVRQLICYFTNHTLL